MLVLSPATATVDEAPSCIALTEARLSMYKQESTHYQSEAAGKGMVL